MEDRRLWGCEIRLLNQKKKAKLTHPNASAAHSDSLPGLQDIAPARTEEAVQRAVSGLRPTRDGMRRMGGTRQEAQQSRGGVSVGAGLSLPSLHPWLFPDLLVLLSNCACFLCFLIPVNLFDFLWSGAASCMFYVNVSNNLRRKRRTVRATCMGS